MACRLTVGRSASDSARGITGNTGGGQIMTKNYNTEKAIQTTREYHQLSEACKKMALARRALSAVQVERTPEIMTNIDRYVSECKASGKPLTHAGFMRCMGINSDIYYQLDKYDHIVEEYKVLHGLPPEAVEHTTEGGEVLPLVPWSTIKKNVCDVLIQEQLEENCYTNRGNPAGSIFGLKARFQWSEDSTPQHVVNNLVIASEEGARKSLEMLFKP